MATQAAIDLSFSGVTNLTSFADLCRYAHWPEDVKVPRLLTGLEQDSLTMAIRHIGLPMIDLTTVYFPELGRELKKLEEHTNVNTDNFKIHLSLKCNFEEWVDSRILSRDVVNNVLIPEIKEVMCEAKKHSELTRTFEQEVRSAFKSPEKTHDGRQFGSAELCETLTEYHRSFGPEKSKYLSPYTSIVAPSGTGKTYTVSQLAIKHNKYVIYLNFAPETANGFPGRSPYASLILSALNSARYAKGSSDRRQNMESIWSLIVEALLHLARVIRTIGIGPAEFFDYQTDQDCKEQQNLIRSCLEFAMNTPPFPDKPGRVNDWKPFETYCEDLFARAGYKKKRNTRSNTFIPGSSTNSLQFVLCIDEARNLLTGTTGEEPNLLFRSLRSALWKSADSGEKTFFAVFLDTASKISNFSPAVAYDPSQKVPTNSRPNTRLFPPFYQIFTKNIFVSPTPARLTEPDTNWSKVFTFGRPLWGALLQQGSTEDSVFTLSLEKCDPKRTGPQADDETVALLALLSYRIPFKVYKFSLAEKFVAGWMHSLADVSEDREDLIVLQPTDPILALAAREHGVTMTPTLVKMLQAFSNALYWNHVNAGEMGEFIAGIILLLAFDGISEEKYFKPIPLQGFLGSLLGQSVVETAEKVFEDYKQSKVKNMLLEGKVFFNRIQRRVTPPNMSDVYNMYRSCTACYLPTSFDGVDILIPVWVPGNADRQEHFGCILVQVKNRAYHSVTPGMLNSAYHHTKDGLKKLKFNEEVPIIGLMMCLRGKKHGTEVQKPSGKSRKNLGVILCVGLEPKQYPIFNALSDDELPQVKQQVLRLLESLLCDIDTQKLEKNTHAYEFTKFETEFYP